MAMPLRMFSLAARLSSLPVVSTLSVRICRFASRDANVRTLQSIVNRVVNRRSSQKDERFEEDPDDVDDVEDKLQSLLGKERKKQRTVKYHTMRRQMTPSGPPERKLSWEAMEQIRYLKQEEPEEWTVERLALGFSVTPDVILRVLRSKFAPTPERKAKQNAKVMARLGVAQPALPMGSEMGRDRRELPGYASTPSMLSSGSGTGSLVTLASQTLMPESAGSKALATTADPKYLATTAGPAAVATLSTELSASPAFYSKHASVTTTSTAEEDDTVYDEEEDVEEEDSWDGLVLSEEELEEFMVSLAKPSPAVQVGIEFFDSKGNFLYRI